ncbi:ureidoglycolate lyase [Variovorax sp. RHLX14]|uniref:ureidoglycolate lyase n=1 Tax=Variovorax sp. RHLX14 TaxID=1259731 RepID=UPI003F44D22F
MSAEASYLRRLTASPLTPETFAPYGTVAGRASAVDGTGRRINAGTTERFDLLDDLRLGTQGGRATLAMFRAQARRFPHEVVEVERHVLGSQTFVPLGTQRFVIVVAPAGAAPTAQSLAAFVTDGRQGIVLAPGTWHHALLAVDGGDFVVVERVGECVDCDIASLSEHVSVAMPD